MHATSSIRQKRRPASSSHQGRRFGRHTAHSPLLLIRRAATKAYFAPLGQQAQHDCALVADALIDPGAADRAEVTRVVALLALDVTKERLPGCVGVAARVPHPAVMGDPNHVQLAVDPGAADRAEVTRVVALLALDVTKERLPGCVGVADRVPHPAVMGDPNHVQLAVDPGAADRAEVTRVVALLALDVTKERLPGCVGVADRVPHPAVIGDPNHLALVYGHVKEEWVDGN